MKKSTTLKAIGLMLALLMLTATACSAVGRQDAVAKKDTLIAAISSEPDTLDPHSSFNSVSMMVIGNIFDSLMNIDTKTGDLIPGMATEYSISEDNLTYTFKLRNDITYHSGRPFNAESVKANLEHIKNDTTYGYRLALVQDITVVDEYTVSVTLSEVNGPFLKSICTLQMIDVDAFNEVGADAFARNPVGSGPFKFKSWEGGNELVLENFPEYYEGEAAIKELMFKIIPDTTNMIISLENGEVNTAHEIAAIDMDSVESNEKLALYQIASAYIEYLYFNCEKEPWSDERVRQAVSLCIDKQSIIDVAFDGKCNTADQPLTELFPGYIKDLPAAERDIEKAKALLAEAGYPDGFTTKILAMDGFRAQAAQVIQANLADIGITAEVELVEFGTLLDMGANGDYEMHIMELGVFYIESYDMLVYNFYTPYSGPSGNYGRGGNAYTDECLEASAKTTDEAERTEYFANVVQENLDKVFCVPLFNRTWAMAADAGLQGLNADPLGQIDYYSVSWK